MTKQRRRRRAPETALETIKRLASDPEYVARKRQADMELQQRETALAHAEAPLVEALNQAGAGVASVWDLVSRVEGYPELYPVLLDHLERDYPAKIREGIARALGSPDAGFAWNRVLRMYLLEPENSAKHGLAVALSAMATDDRLDEIIEILKSPQHGPSRVLFLRALKDSKRTIAPKLLAELADDADLRNEILAKGKHEH